jgi:hypothetical protein
LAMMTAAAPNIATARINSTTRIFECSWTAPAPASALSSDIDTSATTTWMVACRNV